LAAAKELFRVLYCLLAGSGLRIAEAMGLEIGKRFSNDCSIVYVRQQRSKKGHKIEKYPKTDAGIRDVDLHPDLVVLVKEYIGSRKNGFLFETQKACLCLRAISCGTACTLSSKGWDASRRAFTFRRFRESVLQMSEARTLLIDYWMGHANREMSGRYGKQLLDNVQWRKECAAKVGLGLCFPPTISRR
jgi:integrase